MSWYSSTRTCSNWPGHLLRGWRRTQRAPEQEQVVVVEHVLSALAAGVFGEDGADAIGVVGAPGKAAFQDRAEALAGVDHARIDGHQGVFAREAALFAFIAPGLLFAADQVHQVGHIGLVEHREVGREAERSTVLAQEAIGDGVERPAPDLASAFEVDQSAGADSISRAARRENVSSRMRSGGTPCSIR